MLLVLSRVRCLLRSPVSVWEGRPSLFIPGRQLKWVDGLVGMAQYGKHRPQYYNVFSPLFSLGCWFVCLFCPPSPARLSSSPPAGESWARAEGLPRSCPCFRRLSAPSFCSPSLCWFWELWLWAVLAHCWHASSQSIMEHALILDADFFFPSSKTGYVRFDNLFSQNPKLDISVNCWTGLLFLLLFYCLCWVS